MKKLYFLLFAVFFQLMAFSQPVTIGTGTVTTSSSPWDSYYGFSYVQTLYLASEIPATGNITSVEFYYAGTDLSNSDSITMWMGITPKSSFASTTDWVPVTSMTQVFKNQLTGYSLPGWVTIQLSTPFAYNGSGNLVIAVDENTPDYNTNTRFQGTTFTASNRVLYYRNDVTNPDPLAPPAGVRASVVGNININGLTLSPCQPLTDITTGTITTTTGQFSWTAPATGNPVNQYNYEVRTSGLPGSGTTGLAASGNSATTDVTVSGLAPSTNYTIYIRSQCGTANANWVSHSFTTLCGAVTNIFENFDGVGAPALPNCWFKVGTTGTVNTQIANNYSAPNALYLTSSTTTNIVTVSLPPVSNVDSNNRELKFRMRASATVGGVVQVGYLTDPNDPNTFVSMQDVTAATLTYQPYTVTPQGVSGNYVVFAFRHTGSPANPVLIDDVSWSLIPTCAEPTLLVASNVGTTTATIDWTAPASSVTSYEVYYSTTRTTPTASTTPTTTGVTSTTANLTGLTAASKYFYWVRSNCGAGGVSAWSSIDSLTTLCNSTNVPYFENFESAVVPNLPICTQRENAGTGNNWITANNPGSTFTSKTLRYSYNFSNPADAWFYTQGLNLTAGVSYRLSFRYGNNSTTYTESMDVKYGTSPTATSMNDVIVDYPSIKLNGGALSETDFTPTTTGVYYIGFHAYSIANQNGLFVDDIAVTVSPSCGTPSALVNSNITTTGAQIDWTSPTVGSVSSYQVYVSTSNSAPSDTTTPTISGLTATTANLTTLASATKYFYWVRTDCGTGGRSTWSIADSFTTACSATNVPYTQNFESATVPNLPVCTSRENAGTGNNWTIAANPGFTFTSKTLRYTYNGTNAADAWFFTQGLNLTAGVSYRLSFRYGGNSTTYIESMDVKYGTSPNAAAMTDVIVDYPAFNTTVGSLSETDFTPTTSGVYYIGFHAYSIANQESIFVDDISVTVSPTCGAPITLVNSNVTTNSAQIDWTAPSVGTASSYQVFLSQSRIAPGDSTTPTITGISSTTANLTNLSSATKYYYWVRTDCGAGGRSTWSVMDSFTTACPAVNVPYTQNFETATVPGLPNCTSRENAGTGNNWITALNPGSTFTSKTLRYSYNGTNPADAWFYTQGLNLTAGVSYRLTFRYGNNSTTYIESMDVKYGTSPTAAAMTDVIVDYPSININGGAFSETDFTPSTTGVYYIGFHAYSIANQNGLFVDDISVVVTPTCDVPSDLAVSNVTGSAAQLSWTAPTIGTPASYQVYYSTSSTAPNDTTTATISGITNTTTVLNSLSALTTYYVWMKTVCTSTGSSVWSPVFMFTTPCNVITTPTVNANTFDTVPGGCYSRGQGTLADPNTTFTSRTTSTWTIDDFANITSPVNKAARLTISSTTRRDWLFTPLFDLGTARDKKLEFDFALTTANGTGATMLESDDKFAVVISTDYGVTWAAANTIRSWDATTPISNTGEHVVIDLSAYTGVVMFGFYGESTVTNTQNADAFIDNLSITPLLPVTLTNFKGERQGAANMLVWNTASEQNNKGFELQRSSNGDAYTTIGFVASKAANGNSSANISYKFADEKPFTGNNYYRLKQVDIDGRSKYSDVVLIKGGKVNVVTLSSIYPNPAQAKLNVVVAAPANERVTLVVTDLAGKVVMQQASQLVAGDNQLSVNVAKLPSGTYVIKALCNNGCESAVSKFVKQ